ncbi:MAG: hypothetical protein JNG88_01185 [Phycisphaerales bacterium]|nr:hypothetical protein [Phycisphaerales bacterium]
MDADTRHELQQNELGQLLSRLKNLSAREILTYLGTIVVVILIVVGYRTWQSSILTAKSAAWNDLITAGAPKPTADGSDVEIPDRVEALRSYMQTHAEPAALAAARLRLARALIDKAGGDSAERQLLLDEALKHLDALRTDENAAPALRAAAMLLAGTAYETRRDAAKAREMYQRFETPEYASSAFAEIAKKRIETLDQIETQVAFAPGSTPPPTEPTTQPAVVPPSPTTQSGASVLSTPGAPGPATQPAADKP